ncbi:unnamed protein product [Camellia sinensis]
MDGDKDNHEDSDQKNHLHGFDQDAETMIKKVKQALANGEGRRVCFGPNLDVKMLEFMIELISLTVLAGLWGLGCPKSCWELPYLSSWVEHFCCTNGIFEGPIHVNVSHIIRDLSFGPKYPGIHSPLDETIVPTEYRYLSKEVLPTNQFSVTEYYSPMNEYDRTCCLLSV